MNCVACKHGKQTLGFRLSAARLPISCPGCQIALIRQQPGKWEQRAKPEPATKPKSIARDWC